MSRPTLQVEVAFASAPLAISPSYVDISAYVRLPPNPGGGPISIRRGRQNEINRIEAGTLTLTLDNRDRRFDPTNAASPYYPGIVPMKRIRVSAVWSGVTYRLFTGFIEDWPPMWGEGFDSTVTIHAVDGFKYFAGVELTLTRSGPETSGNQIKGAGAILDSLLWPGADQNVQAGDSTLQTLVMTGENVLSRMQLIEASENGLLFIAGDGKLTFQNRHWRLFNATSTVTQGVFGDAAGVVASGALPYDTLAPLFNDSLIFNDIHVTRAGGVEQIATDALSQLLYFQRTKTLTNLQVTTDNETYDAASWLLALYKDPLLRFERMTVIGETNALIWPQALGREISDRITALRTPPGGGAAINLDCYIESVEHQIDLNAWRTTWQLSPADTQSYWILETAGYSELDDTTRPGY